MIRHAINPDANLALIRMDGEVMGADIVEAALQVQADPAWHDGMDVLWIWSTADAVVIAPEELTAIVEARSQPGEGADVCVVNHDRDLAMVSRLMDLMQEQRGKASTTCRTVADALAWLGREELPGQLREMLER